MNCNFLKFHQKIRSTNASILIKKSKLAAPKSLLVWYEVLEFLANFKWLRKNVEVSENLMTMKDKNISFLRKLFWFGQFWS